MLLSTTIYLVYHSLYCVFTNQYAYISTSLPLTTYAITTVLLAIEDLFIAKGFKRGHFYLSNKKRTHYCEFPYIVLCNSISYSLSNACAKSAMISSTFSIPMDTRNCSGFTPAVNCSSGLNWACVVLAG